MVEIVKPESHWRVLDVATGGGHAALAFAPLVREVIASDITQEMLDAAERFIRGKGISNVQFAEADAVSLPFEGGEFDLVTCRIAPHHFPDCALFVREMARVLKPGGVAAVIDNVVPDDRTAADFINAFEKRRDPSHIRAYTKAEWLRFFTDAGFQIRIAEIFRKTLEFESWAGMQGASEETLAELRRMLDHAPRNATEVLAPETREGKLRFNHTEILVTAVR